MAKAKDLSGTRKGVFTLLERKRENGFTYYLCKCDYCNSETWRRSDTITSCKSCGCLKRATKYKIGDIINDLKILDIEKKNKRIYYHCICTYCKKERRVADLKRTKCDCEKYREYIGKTIHNLKFNEIVRVNRNIRFKCTCTLCGSPTIVDLYKVKIGSNKSCGCLQNNFYENYAKPNFVEGTHLCNIKSTKAKKGSKLGVRGVSQVSTGRYVAKIVFKGKYHHLGTFDTLEEAKATYEKARDKYFKPVIDKYKEIKSVKK